MDSHYVYLWVSIGDSGAYVDFDNLDDAIDYLNELRVGKVTNWVTNGFETQNYHGEDYVRMYYGDDDEEHLADIDENKGDQQYVERYLEDSAL